MTKSFIKNKSAINMTVVGFGQAGSRIADNFASYKDENGKSIYNCLALNSNDGDLKGLKHIQANNTASLELGGLGKNPQKAMQILEENENAKEKLKDFITKQVRIEDDLVLFCAGLGGGTGTSTIVKAIEEFYDHYNKPLITQILKKIIEKVSKEEYIKNKNHYNKQAVLLAEEKSVKIGIIATLPLRADGPDVLRQVNDFSQRIWKLANDRTKGISFVTFPDNQFFYDKLKQTPQNRIGDIDNYRDFANNEICSVLHEWNTATTGGGTEVTFDSQDFRRAVLEGNGCLVLNRNSKPMKEVSNGNVIKDMLVSSIDGSSLHSPIEIVQKNESGNIEYAKVHHLGLLAILDRNDGYGSSFIDDARVEIVDNPEFAMTGSIFSGYLEGKNDHSVSVYSLYKTSGLPERLSKGLVNEFEEYQQKQKEIKFSQSNIEQIEIEDIDDDIAFDIDLAELGIEEEKTDTIKEKNKEFDLSDLDLSNIKF
ncbi:cell division protein FtsZ [Cytobacillus purgationiresistens]|uniref:Tubulin/FtsZ GTPase domain-containing protein n=1 Tax=Cytobacillus purgationiresistens TaxID=863449 RepID=A0ABU0AK01_9BACI|nr:cell division protein FtsZ [Cytobacillus purgationiresistens]MDQ0271204.1 hypothetical protein [Cytobacillus purgationiresistens]